MELLYMYGVDGVSRVENCHTNNKHLQFNLFNFLEIKKNIPLSSNLDGYYFIVTQKTNNDQYM